MEEVALKKALLSVMEHQVRRFPEPSEQDRRTARRLRPRIRRMIEKAESPVSYYVKRIVAVLALLLGITGVTLFGFNESVHAGVMRWFQDHFGTNVYRYQNQSGESIDVTKYSLQGLVPEGYQLFDRTVDEDGVNEIFISENGNFLSFTAMNPAYEGEVYLISENEKLTAHVGRFQADVYLSSDANEGNEIVWRGENDALFIIQGFLSKSELVELAEQIR
ncbi:MAG: DUF4367 domain-containing protein [Acetatifactor sp.]|nr:DUF4367 domain-containing protein [Acetatifactor sp.]